MSEVETVPADAGETVMMRRRAITAGVTATAGVIAPLVAGFPAAALAVIVGYVLVGGGRRGWRHPRWYEPMVSCALACIAATVTTASWWAIAFLAVAVLEAWRTATLACLPGDS